MKKKQEAVFASRFVMKSKVKHLCMGCKLEIPVGYAYIRYPAINDEGKFVCMNLCACCAYLWKQKTGEHQQIFKEGEFTDVRIPNFLRKKREIFDREPEKTFREQGVIFFGKHEDPVRNVVVPSSEFSRNFLYFRSRKYAESQFPEGNPITIRAGVQGKFRRVQVVKTQKIDGKSIGKRGKFIAVLVR